MRKLLLTLILMIMISTAIISQEKNRQDQINEYTSKLLLEQITYNGQEGYFISFSSYKQLRFLINDYIFLQELTKLQEVRITKLQKFELNNFKLKTALGISISFNVSELLLGASLSLLCYNLALSK